MPRKRLQYIFLLLFLACLLNISAPCLPAQAEDSSILVSSFSDITGHWAEREIKAWTARELAGGCPDGTFRPESPLTRAEYVTLVNRAYGYTEMRVGELNSFVTSTSPVTFRDVAETDWYVGEIANAVAIGYFGGYPDGTVKPQNPITRQEVATVLTRILPPNNDVQSTNSDSLQGTIAKFVDQDQIPAWSEAAIAAAVSGGYMSGYPDGTFQPTRPITRAEALVVLDRAVGTLYNRAGTYGPFQGNVLLEGNVTINTPGVTLQNTTITGNLYLTEGIGEGDVTLINVTVLGTTKIAGGGRDSIHLRNTTLGNVLVNAPSRKVVYVLAQGNTAVGILEARTPARLEEEGLTGSGFAKVVMNAQPPQEGTGTQDNMSQVRGSFVPVELLGQFSEVEIQSPGVQLNLQRGGIENLTLASPAQVAQSAPPEQSVQPVQITLATQTAVKNLVADSPAIVQGQGTVETTQANVDGVVIGAQAKKVLLADGVWAKVAEKIITENYQYVEPKKKSKDVMLSDLTINGTTVAKFTPDTLEYEFELPFGTTEIPTVAATAHHAKAKVAVTQATALEAPDNVAAVLVTAENGRTQVYTVSFSVALNSAKAITSFSFTLSGSEPDGQVVEGIINEAEKTITVTVPHGTDVTALVPTIIHTGVCISPGEEEWNFSAPVTYTVTAADGTTAEYTVTAYVGPSMETTLSEFKIGEYDILGLPDVTEEEGATLVVPDISGLRGITVRPQDEGTQLVVSLNGTVPEENLDDQEIGYSDVIIVTVTAADGENIAQYKVTVVPVKVTELTVTGAGGVITVGEGQTLQMSVDVEPENATDGTVIWSVENGTGSATIDENDGLLTGTAEGTVTVIATACDGSGFTGTLEVTVVIPVTNVSLNKTEMFLQVGRTTAEDALVANVAPANATNKNVTWSSSDEAIVTVDSNGQVTAEAIGTATITVTTVDGGLTAECTVTVVISTPVIDDCILYLDGREGTYDPATNTWYDLSGEGNHGTPTNFDFDIEGSNVWTGQGLKFDGDDDYVFIDSRPDNLNEFTLETTFTPHTTTKSYQALFTYRKEVNGTRIGLFLSGNKIYWEISSDNRVGDLEGELADFTVENNKTYTVFIKKEANGNTSLVVDGVRYELGLCEGSFTDFDTNIQIGRHLSQQYAKCTFKTVRFYTRALTDPEIMQNYLATHNPEPLSPVDGAVLELRGTEGEKDSQTNVWTDKSGNNNDATLQGFDFDVDADEGDGWTGKALKFDGKNSYAVIADQENQRGMTELTLECWYYPYSWEPMYYGLISKWTYDVRQHYILGYVKKYLREFYFYVSDGDGVNRDELCVSLPELNELTHITATFIGGESLNIYYNGVLQDSKDTTIEKINNDAGEVLCIGKYGYYVCHGEIYRARIYPCALTASEVMQNYLADKNKFTETEP